MAGTNRDDGDGMISDINVTPLVDITLVLLIIFMVTAKIIVSQSLPLDLPKAAAGQEVQQIFGIDLYANGETMVDGKKIPNDDAILPLAREAQAKNADLRVIIRADQAIQHGRVMRALDLLKQAGVSKIAFAVSPVPPEPGGKVPGAPAAPIPVQGTTP